MPLELTNHTQLQSEVDCKAREQRVFKSHVSIAKVIVASHGNRVNFVTTNS